MASEGQQTELQRRASKKSVAFTDEKLIVEADGSVKMETDAVEPKDSAQGHSAGTPLLKAAIRAATDDASQADAVATATETAAEDGGDLDFSGLKKKKKAKKEIDPESAPGDDADLDLDLSGLKKKKKVKKTAGDEFAQKLALKLEGKDGDEAPAEETEQDGDLEKGTGIWAHDETKTINYESLLSRFFVLLTQRNPDHASSGVKSYKIPPPQCLREGNKKTVFANISDICKRMKRSEEHVIAYMFSELGTSGSTSGTDGKDRKLIIKGRFQTKQIESVLRSYIMEYVSCRTCRSPNTELSKGENRLYFVTCNNCQSRRSVSAIKSGFSAQIGRRKKMG